MTTSLTTVRGDRTDVVICMCSCMDLIQFLQLCLQLLHLEAHAALQLGLLLRAHPESSAANGKDAIVVSNNDCEHDDCECNSTPISFKDTT